MCRLSAYKEVCRLRSKDSTPYHLEEETLGRVTFEPDMVASDSTACRGLIIGHWSHYLSKINL